MDVGRHAEAKEVWLSAVAMLRELAYHAGIERVTASMRDACTKAGISPFDAPLPA